MPPLERGDSRDKTVIRGKRAFPSGIIGKKRGEIPRIRYGNLGTGRYIIHCCAIQELNL
ncbi:MAG: hypothetical protein LBG27_02070 [Spirochaetaceae bacterium]|nr:hypothetical protein [Spirochaetaceae bacterium]